MNDDVELIYWSLRHSMLGMGLFEMRMRFEEMKEDE
jgi:hypothetical protein